MTEESNIIDKANQAALRLETANATNLELIKRMEAHEARTILGGQSDAGQAKQPEISKEDKDKADTNRIFKNILGGQ